LEIEPATPPATSEIRRYSRSIDPTGGDAILVGHDGADIVEHYVKDLL
jgi:hypothetical protein